MQSRASLFHIRKLSNLTTNFHSLLLIYIVIKTGMIDSISQGKFGEFRKEHCDSPLVLSMMESGESVGLWNRDFTLTGFGKNFTSDDPSGFRAWIIGLVELQSEMLRLVPSLLELQRQDSSARFNHEIGPQDEIGISKAAEGVAKFLGFRALEKIALFRKENCRVLDIGCGLGEYLIQLSRLNPSLRGVGIEESQQVAYQARDRIKLGNHNKLAVICGDIFKNNFGTEEKFDACLLNFVLHYFSQEERKELFERCKELLNNNGEIVILEPVLNNLGKKQRIELTAFNLNLYPQSKMYHGLPRMRELNSALEKAGFRISRKIKPFPVGPAMCFEARRTD